MFATDRHLLILEPNLVRDVAWIGQRLVKGAGDIADTTLTMTSQDIGFDLVGAEPGQVVVAGGVAYEIVQVLDADQLTISRIRAEPDGPILPPSPASGVAVELPTFQPQLAMVHAQVLRMLGIDPDEIAMPGAITEASITNGESLALFEALGALHLIFTAAAALSGPGSPAAYKANLYRERFIAERSRAIARIDTDGDGLPDATRRPSLILTVRA
ncbi:MAG TPA: hypothetical protein VFF69_11680 [Phycisphaerales bacterium]|nr:hypothetical protein [Phycisphaerales bacterium]